MHKTLSTLEEFKIQEEKQMHAYIITICNEKYLIRVKLKGSIGEWWIQRRKALTLLGHWWRKEKSLSKRMWLSKTLTDSTTFEPNLEEWMAIYQVEECRKRGCLACPRCRWACRRGLPQSMWFNDAHQQMAGGKVRKRWVSRLLQS